jgi:hypothetical protein
MEGEWVIPGAVQGHSLGIDPFGKPYRIAEDIRGSLWGCEGLGGESFFIL